MTTFTAFEIALIVPVFLLLGFASLAILIFPFRTYARLFGDQVRMDASGLDISAAQTVRAGHIGRVIRSTAKITPWASLCLAQAMVATLLLRLVSIPYCVFFGLSSKNDTDRPDPLAAHAWVRAGERNITGGQQVGRHTVVMVFEYRTRRAR